MARPDRDQSESESLCDTLRAITAATTRRVFIDHARFQDCGPVLSEPATIVAIIPGRGCWPADLDMPLGTLRFFDLGEFLNLFGQGCP